MSDTPRTNAEEEILWRKFGMDGQEPTRAVSADFARQLEVELAVVMTRLELWRERAFDANASEEMVEIDGLIGEWKAMRRAYEEGTADGK